MTPTPRECRGCATLIPDPIANQQYCGPECRPSYKRDPGHQLRRYEQDPDYEYSMEKWRRYVAEEGGYVCADCDTTKDLHAHHITPRASGGKNTVRNGKLLCRPCHEARHAAASNPEAFVDRIVARVMLELLEAP